MRVVAGKYKGLKLLSPKSNVSKPTDNKVKEAIFDMLYPYKENFISLDLFAGTGQMGIEFLSRGAGFVYFNERNSRVFTSLKDNLDKLDTNSYKLSKVDFRKALLLYKEDGVKFDYIFLDPPYDSNMLNRSISLILEYDLIKDRGIIITESDMDLDFSDNDQIDLIKEKSYGRKKIKIYIK